MKHARLLGAAAAVFGFSIAAAQAADLSLIPPPAAAPVYGGGWYLRGSVGMTNEQVKSLALEPLPASYAGETITTPFLGFDSSPLFNVGIGYQFNPWLRFDGTAEYRGAAHFHGQQVESQGGATLPDDYNADKTELLFLANAFIDLGNWWGVTPFIGGGIGVSDNKISNFMDFGASQSGITGPPCACILSTTYFDNASKTNFAWALYAGLSYRVTPAVSLELMYRYTNLGDATTGAPHAFDGSQLPGNSPFVFHDITSNDLMLGVRWMLDVPYAAPLRSRG